MIAEKTKRFGQIKPGELVALIQSNGFLKIFPGVGQSVRPPGLLSHLILLKSLVLPHLLTVSRYPPELGQLLIKVRRGLELGSLFPHTTGVFGIAELDRGNADDIERLGG